MHRQAQDEMEPLVFYLQGWGCVRWETLKRIREGDTREAADHPRGCLVLESYVRRTQGHRHNSKGAVLVKQ